MDTTTRNILIAIAVVVIIIFVLPTVIFAVLVPVTFTTGPVAPFGGRFFGELGNTRLLVLIAMLAIIVLFLVAVIVGIVLLVRWAVRSGGGAAPVHREDAIEILRRRYAAGEISKEEFDQKKRDITGT